METMALLAFQHQKSRQITANIQKIDVKKEEEKTGVGFILGKSKIETKSAAATKRLSDCMVNGMEHLITECFLHLFLS